MSSQRGNVARCRPQKYKNKRSFDNLRFDSNHRSKQVADTDVVQVRLTQYQVYYK